MPDLITHTSFNYLIYKLIKKKIPLSLFLFGAILPDLFSALFIILIDFFKLFHILEDILIYIVPSHSIFSALLYSIIFGLIFKDKKAGISAIFIGYILHLFLDLLQNNWGYGNLLLYPFYIKPLSLDLFTLGIEYRYIYLIIPFIIIVFMFLKEQKKDILTISLKIKSLLLPIVILLLMLCINFLSTDKIIKSNIYSINFRYNPASYNNKILTISKIRPIKTDPPMIKYRRTKLKLFKIPYKLNKNYAYSLKGIYNHKDKSLEVIKIYQFIPHIKAYLSISGLFLFILFLLLKVKLKIL